MHVQIEMGPAFYAQRALKLELRRIVFLFLEGTPILGTVADGADFRCSSWAVAAWSLSFILTTLRSVVIMLKLMRSEVTGRFVTGVELVTTGAGVGGVVVSPVRMSSSTPMMSLQVEGRMRRRKRGEEGGVTTLALE